MAASRQTFDIIFIGSGIGALTGASILAQLSRKRVLVLEQHFKVGGFTHIFKRKGRYEWDVGLHYVGEMQRGEMPRAVFDYITRGGLRWNRMPDPYDVFVYPDFTFKVRSGEEQLKADLIKQFPGEKKAVEGYFSDIKKVIGWFNRYFFASTLPGSLKRVSALLSSLNAKLAMMTTVDYFNRHFKDPLLKGLLTSQWGDYGLPPSLSAFAIHAMIVHHYLNGGYYPAGGSKSIADSIMPLVEAAGGQFLVNHEVQRILIKDDKAVGVQVFEKKGKEIIEKEYFADVIISNAGAYQTYTHLIPEEYPLSFREDVRNFPLASGNVTLYLGLKADPRTIGLNGENYWIFSSHDHDRTYQNRNELLNGKAGAAYVSFPSLKNPAAKAHTAEIIAFADHECFRSWSEAPWQNRGAEYEQLKKKIADGLIEFSEPHLKGLKALIDYQELSTPLSTEHFTRHRSGNIYGIPAIPRRYHSKWAGVLTPIKNLYLTGADAGAHGIVGAMMGGVMAAGTAMGGGLSIPKIFKTARRYSERLTV